MQQPFSFGPWLWGARLDLGVFGGSALLALGAVAWGHWTGISRTELPEMAWLACVLAIDVAHVYATLFRTYLDRAELAANSLRYLAIPALAYVAGVLLYAFGSGVFWRVLAYLAVVHFIQQQVGWTRVYRARARQGLPDRVIDEAAVYTSTLYPLAVWHERLETARFSWFLPGDFVNVTDVAARVAPVLQLAWWCSLVVFGVRQLWLALRRRVIHTGKVVVVVSTALAWYVGIVATNSDFDFTVTNVIIHGAPYCALLWAYARQQQRHAPDSLGALIASGGLAAFAGTLIAFAFVEELLWDRFVWHERSWIFGAGAASLAEGALSLLVPLLALPQTVHYLFDGLLWRRGETRRLPAQRAALGFEPGG